MAYELIRFTADGLYCERAGIYIDPWKPVEKAIITHSHSDHARYGSRHYLAHKDSQPVMKMRLGDISLQTAEYEEVINMNGVRISLHPAGHIVGSAQVRLECKGEVWVVSGDYKLQPDNFCKPFETVKCNVFITESTFGLPVYKWQDQKLIFSTIREWWQENMLMGKTSILAGYALGKMQRLLTGLKPYLSDIYAHGAIYNLNELFRMSGHDLPALIHTASVQDKKLFKGALVLAPASALNSSWMKKFDDVSTAYCSGWMAVRGAKNRRSVDRGFALSDHADWNDLNYVVADTGAEKVYVTHGYTDVFSRWLNEQGIHAEEVKTRFGDEEAELLAEAKNDVA